MHRKSIIIRHPQTQNLLFKHSTPWTFILGCIIETRAKANFCSRTLRYTGLTYILKLWNLPEEFFQWGKWKLRHLGCLGWTQNVPPETKEKKSWQRLQLLWLQFFFQLWRDGHNEALNASSKRNFCFVFCFFECLVIRYWPEGQVIQIKG